VAAAAAGGADVQCLGGLCADMISDEAWAQLDVSEELEESGDWVACSG
jgi:hypothetical protein